MGPPDDVRASKVGGGGVKIGSDERLGRIIDIRMAAKASTGEFFNHIATRHNGSAQTF